MDAWDAVTVPRPVTSSGVADVHGNQHLVTSLAQVDAAEKGAQAVSDVVGGLNGGGEDGVTSRAQVEAPQRGAQVVGKAGRGVVSGVLGVWGRCARRPAPDG